MTGEPAAGPPGTSAAEPPGPGGIVPTAPGIVEPTGPGDTVRTGSVPAEPADPAAVAAASRRPRRRPPGPRWALVVVAAALVAGGGAAVAVDGMRDPSGDDGAVTSSAARDERAHKAEVADSAFLTALGADAVVDGRAAVADARAAAQAAAAAEAEAARLAAQEAARVEAERLAAEQAARDAAASAAAAARPKAGATTSTSAIAGFVDGRPVDASGNVLWVTSVPTADGNGSNGNMPMSAMCTIPWGTDQLGYAQYLRCDAADALTALNDAFRAQFGASIDMDLTYRSYADQVAMKAALGGLAAKPGTSTHGLGTALDVQEWTSVYGFGTPRYDWLVANGPTYGWFAPARVREGQPYAEYWHLEYGPGHTS